MIRPARSALPSLSTLPVVSSLQALPTHLAHPAHRTLLARFALLTLLTLLALLALPPARLAAQDASSSNSALTVVSGTVYDSLSGKPLAGALVQLVGRSEASRVFSTETDVRGEFRMAGVQRGQYFLGFMHPFLDSLGLGIPPVVVDVTGEPLLQTALAIPSAAAIQTQLCTTREPGDSTGMILGFIRDADTGMPLDSSTVVVMWTELVVSKTGIRTERRQVPTKANSAGWYALCGVPTEGPITARAERGENASGYIEIVVPPRGLLHRDFGIPTGSAALAVADTGAESMGEPVRRGTALLSVVVRDEQRKPLAGARLLVQGSGATGSTNDDGALTLSDLPAGTQTLEARYVGYSPKRVTVDLASGRTSSVTVTMDQRANTLGEVTVYGKKSRRSRDISGFLERSRRGMGRFLTRADIEKRQPFQFTDLMRTMPGLRVVRTSGFDYTIVSSRGGGMGGACQPQVYLDGIRLVDAQELNTMVQPSDIAGVEIYAGVSEAPPQYSEGSCGSILIWTGPNLGAAGRE